MPHVYALIIVALVFNATDFITGFLSALKTKTVNSTKLRDGLFKKIGFIVCYFLALLLDTQGAMIGFNVDVEFLPIIVGYAVLTELVSIIENVSVLNPDVLPEKLKELFHIEKEENK